MIERWRDLPVLVTGGHGFLGSHVVHRLRARGARIHAPRSVEADLRDPAACRALLHDTKPEVIIHCAVDGGGIGYMREHPASVGFNNVFMNLHLLQAAAEQRVGVFVGVSSICAYPRITPIPMREEHLWEGYPEPTNGPYGLSKRIMMALGQACRQQYGLNAVFPMPVNLYGPRDDFDPARSHVVPALIQRFERAVEAGEQVVVAWGTGQVTRELFYVEDCADALVLAAERLETSEPFNLGTGVETKVCDLAQAVADEVGFRGEIRWDPTFPDGQPRKCLDISRARDWLGWSAQVSLAEGLRRTVAWYRAERAAGRLGGP
ncbi:MAG: NAD-dependent epimerase/dehydratase family protein [Pseudomonadota bacterium]